MTDGDTDEISQIAAIQSGALQSASKWMWSVVRPYTFVVQSTRRNGHHILVEDTQRS